MPQSHDPELPQPPHRPPTPRSPADRWERRTLLRLDKPDGTIIAELPIEGTTGRGIVWQSAPLLQKVQGVHDLYVTFKGSGANLYVFAINSFDSTDSTDSMLENTQVD